METEAGVAIVKSESAEPGDASGAGGQGRTLKGAIPKAVGFDSSRTRGRSKSWWNFWLDAVLAAVFTALSAVSGVVQFVFPAPSAASGWTVWGASLDQWLVWQFGILCVLAAGIVLHVMLHWSWVCGMLARGRKESPLRTDDGIRTLVGVGFLIAILHVIGVFVVAAFLSVQAP